MSDGLRERIAEVVKAFEQGVTVDEIGVIHPADSTMIVADRILALLSAPEGEPVGYVTKCKARHYAGSPLAADTDPTRAALLESITELVPPLPEGADGYFLVIGGGRVKAIGTAQEVAEEIVDIAPCGEACRLDGFGAWDVDAKRWREVGREDTAPLVEALEAEVERLKAQNDRLEAGRDSWAHLDWIPTIYPEIETAWSAEDDAYLARWRKVHPVWGPMADGVDRTSAVSSLIEVTHIHIHEWTRTDTGGEE